MKNITLQQYISYLREEIDKFESHWQSMKGNDDYPNELLPGDWKEQLDIFMSSLDEEI